MAATLLRDGDVFEKHYWNAFISTYFSSYEKYWSNKIVPLTNRPANIHFKNSEQLQEENFTTEDVCKAQLHYTVLRHLARGFEILQTLRKTDQTFFDIDLLSEGMFHITGAQDVAFEFLQRHTKPNYYDPWAPAKASKTSQPGSKEAADDWKRANNHPLNHIRKYRNHLAHGLLSPSITKPPKILLPIIGRENNYLDWRLITDWNINSAESSSSDFDSIDNILANAWETTIVYLEKEWSKIL